MNYSKPCIFKPFRWKFLVLCTKVASPKYTQLKHLLRCKLWLEVGRKVLAHRFSKLIGILLHAVVNMDYTRHALALDADARHDDNAVDIQHWSI